MPATVLSVDGTSKSVCGGWLGKYVTRSSFAGLGDIPVTSLDSSSDLPFSSLL